MITQNPYRINSIGETTDTLTSRGGLALFVRYLENSGVLEKLASKFADFKESKKGYEMHELFRQFISFFADGTDLSLSQFDRLKQDPGYAAVLETTVDKLYSSHQVKRFLKKFHRMNIYGFRDVFRKLFIERLHIEKPKEILIFFDTKVLDNHEAGKREGCSWSYKKVRGFQPLHFIWNGLFIDLVFRGGKKHGNSGETVRNAVKNLVRLIREQYDKDAEIVFLFDAGFFDEANFKLFEELEVGYVCSGKKLDFVKEKIQNYKPESFETHQNNGKFWKYHEFWYRCDCWIGGRRAIYTIPVAGSNEQLNFDFSCDEHVIITGFPKSLCLLKSRAAGEIIDMSHSKGNSELTHRKEVDFGRENLPLKIFEYNAAYYSIMVLSFTIFQCFVRDVPARALPGISAESYPTTVRRKCIDFAAKIVRKAHKVTLKATRAVRESLKLDLLWEMCNSPPRFCQA